MVKAANVALALLLTILVFALFFRGNRHRDKAPATVASHDPAKLPAATDSVPTNRVRDTSSDPAKSTSSGAFLSANQRLEDTSASVGGELEFSLTWDTCSDLDLSVVDPLGFVVDGYHAVSPGGGVLDVDANPTPLTVEGDRRYTNGQLIGTDNQLDIPASWFDGRRKDRLPGSNKPESVYTLTPVEHIHFLAPPPGRYLVRVHCFSWRESHTNPIHFMVEARSKGVLIRREKGMIGPKSLVSDKVTPTTVFILHFP